MSEQQAIPDRPATSKTPSITRFIRYEHLIAGVSGGVTSTLVLHPLDLIKIRFQVNDGSGKLPAYRGLTDAVKSIVRTAGLKGLYQGVTPNVWGNGSAWGLYFFSYNILKAWMQKDSDKPLGFERHLIAGAVADIDECKGNHSRRVNATCTNTNGSYLCECHPGFSGNGQSCTVEFN